MSIPLLNNGDSGLTARTIINDLVNSANSPDGFPYTGSANISGSLNATDEVSADLFMHPQNITADITIPAGYNGFLIDPVGVTGTITVEPTANLVIVSDDFATSSSYAANASQAESSSYTITASYSSISNDSLTAISASYAITSSFANNSNNTISSSYALTASYALNGGGGGGGSIDTSSLATTGSNTFIGNQTITGSINISSSLQANLDSSGGPANGLYAIDTTTSTLNSLNPAGGSPSQGGPSINWYDRELLDGYGAVKLDWVNGYLKDGLNTTLDWYNRVLYDYSYPTPIISVDWGGRYLYDTNGPTISIDWGSRYLNDFGAVPSVDWNSRYLYDNGFPFPGVSIDWNNRQLLNIGGVAVLDWSGLFGAPITFTGTSSYATYAETASFAQVLTLQSYDPLPSSPAGTIAVSASTPPKPYFYDGSTWNALY